MFIAKTLDMKRDSIVGLIFCIQAQSIRAQNTSATLNVIHTFCPESCLVIQKNRWFSSFLVYFKKKYGRIKRQMDYLNKHRNLALIVFGYLISRFFQWNPELLESLLYYIKTIILLKMWSRVSDWRRPSAICR